MAKYSVNDKCPCGSNIKYKKCCQAFHKGKLPSIYIPGTVYLINYKVKK